MIVVRYRPRATGSGFATSASFGVPVVQDSMTQAMAIATNVTIAAVTRVQRMAKSSQRVVDQPGTAAASLISFSIASACSSVAQVDRVHEAPIVGFEGSFEGAAPTG